MARDYSSELSGDRATNITAIESIDIQRFNDGLEVRQLLRSLKNESFTFFEIVFLRGFLCFP